jgi:hypothetical protein
MSLPCSETDCPNDAACECSVEGTRKWCLAHAEAHGRTCTCHATRMQQMIPV